MADDPLHEQRAGRLQGGSAPVSVALRHGNVDAALRLVEELAMLEHVAGAVPVVVDDPALLELPADRLAGALEGILGVEP